MNTQNTPTANGVTPCINFENWGEAFDFAREIINLCECTADNLANNSQNKLTDWEYTELMGANEFSIKYGLQLVKKIIPFTDIEQILK